MNSLSTSGDIALAVTATREGRKVHRVALFRQLVLT